MNGVLIRLTTLSKVHAYSHTTYFRCCIVINDRNWLKCQKKYLYASPVAMILNVIWEMPLHREQQHFCRVMNIVLKLRVSPSIPKHWLCSPTCENFKIDQQTCFISFMYLHMLYFLCPWSTIFMYLYLILTVCEIYFVWFHKKRT